MKEPRNELFAQAIVEALSAQNKEELSVNEEPVVCTNAHYEKLSEILGFCVTPRESPEYDEGKDTLK